ncbi:hypothetical protein T02_11775 [Trichinella nativa]|uniref:Uncharacterized protein n=3 Tax=Trichinella TaxID=6333 RepID=A0A0V1LN40_9BILA|nr:hypothetical protein T05_15916 [Trichinella murrelli]KRY54708.1 hypothetical protein T03_7679 [Trichinella britovi]KRZ60791.1 hypothetical protein T02_11775 [Trichinella nativa]KRZ89092.1 hypothetical protein T08_4903 [Trichinella sp. T8]
MGLGGEFGPGHGEVMLPTIDKQVFGKMDRHGLVNADRSEHLVRGFGRANAHHSNL